ncbi:MAG: hypothetical protein QNJ91_10155 [Gammaproteobacteria bacterium]|nr:hypothetical protein [Gammaproteobacteria bacterium]
MKTQIIAAIVAIGSQAALAEPFAFQKAVGSSELDPSIWEGPGEVVQRGEPREFVDALEAVYKATNLDGRQPFEFVGTITPSGPTRISLYEAYRDTPEGTAYQDYYAQFPADTDWAAVAQEFKARGGDV